MGGGGGGKREIIYLSLHRHHQNDSCIKVGSDESHILMFHNCEGQSHKTVSADHIFTWIVTRFRRFSHGCPRRERGQEHQHRGHPESMQGMNDSRR